MLKKALMLIAVILLAVVIVALLFSQGGTSEIEKKEQEKAVSLSIEGPSKIEIGRQCYTLSIKGALCREGFPRITWESTRTGQIMSQDGPSVELMAHQPGEITLSASYSGLNTQKVIQVYSKADIAMDMEIWIHPGEWYATGIISSGITKPSLTLYRALETGRRVETSSDCWDSHGGAKEIVIRENGNYILVAKGKALSDGRSISSEWLLTVTPYVQRSYHEFSWDNENLVQLTPEDKLAIINFLQKELSVNVSLSPREKQRSREVNKVSSDYLFYKDSSRKDTLLYQKGVSSQGDRIREMYQSSYRMLDGRYLYVSWDDFIVAANMIRYGTSLERNSGSSGGSTSGGSTGGGPSPSPDIDGPSPSPPV